MNPLKVFIGYDSREPVGYHVCAHSILARASEPVAVIPLRLDTLREAGYYWRPTDEKASTEFSLSRFLVPFLCDYEGWALFMDSDMLVCTDIVSLASYTYLNTTPSVFVCQHHYTPKAETKMDGKPQAVYPRKNWSSLMIFNNSRCGMLTPEYVNTATPMELHRFMWAGEHGVGSLPLDLNWLVGEYEPNPNARILHYTNGLPCFLDYERCDHADLWLEEYSRMVAPVRAGPFAREAWMRGTV